MIKVTHAELLPDNKGVVLDLLYDDGYEQRIHSPYEDNTTRFSEYVERASIIIDEHFGPLNWSDWNETEGTNAMPLIMELQDRMDEKYGT